MSSTNINVVFGCMTFGAAGKEQARVHDVQTCQAILDVFKKHGHRKLDSARMYGAGTSEVFLSQMGVAQQGFQVATKNFPNARFKGMVPFEKEYDHGKEGIHRCLQDSLEALKMDAVDLYYLHAPDRETPFEETLAAIDAEYRAGKFKRFGISNYTADEVREICRLCDEHAWVKPSVYQGLYNCLARTAEAPLFPVLREHGISFYGYNPLLGGLASGKYEREAAGSEQQASIEKGSRFDKNARQGQMYRARYFKEAYFDAIDLLKRAAETHGLTLPETVLRWVQHHSILKPDFGDATIIGASSLNHIEQNLLDFEKGPLPAELVQSIDEAWAIVEQSDAKPKYHF